jgi:hypothetical protein
MNHTKISTHFGVLIIAIIAVFVAVLVLKYAENNQTAQVSDNSIPKTSIPKKQEPQDTKNQSAPVHYENTTYGFALKLPKEWAGYREMLATDEKVSLESSDTKYSPVERIDMLVPTDDPNKFFTYFVEDDVKTHSGHYEKVDGYMLGFVVYVTDRKKWEDISASPQCQGIYPMSCPQAIKESVIGENDRYVFYMFPQGTSEDGTPYSGPKITPEYLQKNFSVLPIRKK